MITKKPGPCTSFERRSNMASSSSLQVVMLAATMAALKPMTSMAISASPILISACHIFSRVGKL